MMMLTTTTMMMMSMTTMMMNWWWWRYCPYLQLPCWHSSMLHLVPPPLIHNQKYIHNNHNHSHNQKHIHKGSVLFLKVFFRDYLESFWDPQDMFYASTGVPVISTAVRIVTIIIIITTIIIITIITIIIIMKSTIMCNCTFYYSQYDTCASSFQIWDSGRQIVFQSSSHRNLCNFFGSKRVF